MLFPKNETMKLLLEIMALREFSWWFVIATPKHFTDGVNLTKNQWLGLFKFPFGKVKSHKKKKSESLILTT